MAGFTLTAIPVGCNPNDVGIITPFAFTDVGVNSPSQYFSLTGFHVLNLSMNNRMSLSIVMELPILLNSLCWMY